MAFGQQRGEARAVPRVVPGQPGQLREGRCEINVRHQSINGALADAWPTDHERDSRVEVVDPPLVRDQVELPQLEAVVRREEEIGVVRFAVRLDRRHERFHQVVDG